MKNITLEKLETTSYGFFKYTESIVYVKNIDLQILMILRVLDLTVAEKKYFSNYVCVWTR